MSSLEMVLAWAPSACLAISRAQPMYFISTRLEDGNRKPGSRGFPIQSPTLYRFGHQLCPVFCCSTYFLPPGFSSYWINVLSSLRTMGQSLLRRLRLDTQARQAWAVITGPILRRRSGKRCFQCLCILSLLDSPVELLSLPAHLSEYSF